MKTDLSMLQELGDSLRPATEHPPAEIRHRVMTELRHPARRPRRLPALAGVRLAWRLGAPAGVAAAIAAAMIASQATTIAGGAPAPPDPHRTAASDAPGTVAPAGARQVLRLAAQHAAATPELAARPNQFLFIDTVEVQSTTDLKPGRNGETVAGRTTVSGPLPTRTWLSVDGTRDGMVIQQPDPRSGQGRPTRTDIDGCTNGLQAETIDRPATTRKVRCTPEPAYRPGGVPTDPDRLLTHVNQAAAADPTLVAVPGTPGQFVRLSADQRAFQEIAELLYRNHSPAVHEAAFRAAERISGVELRQDVTDASGRPGVAVTRTEAGSREELVFHPNSHAYLGHNIVAAAFDPAGAEIVREPSRRKGSVRLTVGTPPKPGDVIYKSALLRIAIVDRAGQLP